MNIILGDSIVFSSAEPMIALRFWIFWKQHGIALTARKCLTKPKIKVQKREEASVIYKILSTFYHASDCNGALTLLYFASQNVLTISQRFLIYVFQIWLDYIWRLNFSTNYPEFMHPSRYVLNKVIMNTYCSKNLISEQ